MSAGIRAFQSVKSNSIIQSIDGQKIPDVATFIEIIKAIPERKCVIVESTAISDLPITDLWYIIIHRLWAPEMTLVSQNVKGS
jgi:pro-apoptotic serine protease NMA111